MPLPSFKKNNEDAQSLTAPSPSSEDSLENQDESSDVELNVKPELLNAKSDSKTEIKVSAPKGGIPVVATRKGFYNQTRLKEGAEFKIKDESEFGDWFKCVDSQFEKMRLDFIKNKKAGN